ncbi:hypothetical protein, partial [uncultured Selenomonas sp.]|uniref:hypothetical protein n=1 Tax=uncultured Selenomonas sp. TaxID=159275 RepID=UPI0028DB60D0
DTALSRRLHGFESRTRHHTAKAAPSMRAVLFSVRDSFERQAGVSAALRRGIADDDERRAQMREDGGGQSAAVLS